MIKGKSRVFENFYSGISGFSESPIPNSFSNSIGEKF